MPKGVVKEYNSNCGCGIIVDSETGKNLILYANYIIGRREEMIQEGQFVEYAIEKKRNENWAVNVRFINWN